MNVELSEEALADLSDILYYVAKDNPRAAVRLVNGIEESCRRLGKMPGAGTARDDLKPGLRMFSHGSYVICFRRKSNDLLRIVRIMHGARDVKAGDF